MNNPPLIIFCGMSGAGKTTTAELISKEFGIELLNPEAIRREMGRDRYCRSDTPEVLFRQISRIRQLFAEGKTAIIDNNLLSPILRQFFYDLAEEEGRRVICFDLKASLPELTKRIQERPKVEGGPPTDARILVDQRSLYCSPSKSDAMTNEFKKHISCYSINTERRSFWLCFGVLDRSGIADFVSKALFS